jgi:hypothetical protein
MQIQTPSSRVLRLVSVLLLAVAPVAAQAQKISFKKNATDSTALTTVDLATNTTVQILANGDIDAVCTDANDDNRCDSIPTSGGNPPVIDTFTRSKATVAPGESFTITWATTNADVCRASSTPPNNLWSGPKDVAGSSNVSFPSPLTTPAALALVCYNTGSSEDGLVQVAVEGQTQPPTGCSRTDPLINPTGLSRASATWQSIFGKPFPPDAGGVRNLTLGTTQYAVLPFTTTANRNYTMETLPLYEGNASSGMYVSISDCEADFRGASTAEPPPGDPTLASMCRINVGPESNMSFTTQSSADRNYNCVLEPNKTYYMNIIMSSSSGTVGNSNTCGGASSCTMPFNVK